MSKEKIVGVEFIRLCATIGVIMNHVGVCWISAYGDTANANGLVLFKRDYPSDCVNRKLQDFSRSFFIYILTL